MQASKEHLPLLLEHPLEPVFLPKGKDNIVLEVPDDYINPEDRRYKSNPRLFTPAKPVQVGDALTDAFKRAVSEKNTLGRDEDFSIFAHHEIAGHYIDLLYKLDVEKLMAGAIYARERLNPSLFNYVLHVVLLHRADTRDLPLPPLVKAFPGQFLTPDVLAKGVEAMTLLPAEKRGAVRAPFEWTAQKWEPEHRLFYFREDLGVGIHHHHWHAVYPFSGSREIVDKDRRGELFYYMHQQMVARYDFERLCNGLELVKPLSDFRGPIQEGYFSKLASKVSSGKYGGRAAARKLRNVDRDGLKVDLNDMERWRERIFDAIAKGELIDKNKKPVPLTEKDGIDKLGNVVEASTLSVNRRYYGNLHNAGHVVIAFEHDPDNRYKENSNVMFFDETAMRDPVFFRWHKFINDIFVNYKDTLQPYEKKDLEFKNIKIWTENSESRVKNDKLDLDEEVNTYWEESEVELSSGMDFVEAAGPLVVRFTHLQHDPFTYHLVVDNGNPTTKYGTCRIFLAPLEGDKGPHGKWTLQEQRHVMIELDKFKVEMKPGKHPIIRKSSQSSVTIPFKQMFSSTDKVEKGRYCGCGWPDYMLLPKGYVKDLQHSVGMQCNVFVMISNYDDDKVSDEEDGEKSCHEAYSFCGVRNRKYPDRRAMGFPFDRPVEKDATLDSFVKGYPNMALLPLTINASEFPKN